MISPHSFSGLLKVAAISLEGAYTQKKISVKQRAGFFYKDKIDKPLARLIKKKRELKQIKLEMKEEKSQPIPHNTKDPKRLL